MSFDADYRDVVEGQPAPRRGAPPSDEEATTQGVTRQSVVGSATRHPYIKAFTCAGVIYLFATGLLLMVVAYRVLPRATAYEVGDAIAGAMLLFALPSIVSAIVTGLVVSLSPRAWSMPQIALVFLPLFLLTLALQLLIARSG